LDSGQERGELESGVTISRLINYRILWVAGRVEGGRSAEQLGRAFPPVNEPKLGSEW